jgi:hypothetical protein
MPDSEELEENEEEDKLLCVCGHHSLAHYKDDSVWKCVGKWNEDQTVISGCECHNKKMVKPVKEQQLARWF